MDLDKGTFLHWPLGEVWEDNEEILELMSATRRAWHFFVTAEARQKRGKWTTSEINYDTWINEGRTVIEMPSSAEEWAKEHGYLIVTGPAAQPAGK
jgi:hypothetical protein